MRENRTSGLMSGVGKRGGALRQCSRPTSTLPDFSGGGQTPLQSPVFHRPSSGIVSRRPIPALNGLWKGHETPGKFFSFVPKLISSTAPHRRWRGLRLQVLLEVEAFGFSSAGSPTPADKGPATDNWTPSKPIPYAPSPGSARRSSAASCGSSIPALGPVPSLSSPAAATH
jgi:hypothetical protein